jgi:hypothetical protein
VEYIYKELTYGGDYSKVVAAFEDSFDIVVIDGRDRVNCVLNCLGALKSNGAILWDDSDREQYLKGYDFLNANCFRRLDFKGLGQVSPSSGAHQSSTKLATVLAFDTLTAGLFSKSMGYVQTT